MKFLCKTEFFHSGARLYTDGTVYTDITQKVAEELIAVDKNIPLGALSFFTPIDDEAIKFVKDRLGKEPAPAEKKDSATIELKPPTRAELIAEAKGLGIVKAQTMKTDVLIQAIAAAREKQADPPSPSVDNAEPLPMAQR